MLRLRRGWVTQAGLGFGGRRRRATRSTCSGVINADSDNPQLSWAALFVPTSSQSYLGLARRLAYWTTDSKMLAYQQDRSLSALPGWLCRGGLAVLQQHMTAEGIAALTLDESRVANARAPVPKGKRRGPSLTRFRGDRARYGSSRKLDDILGCLRFCRKFCCTVERATTTR